MIYKKLVLTINGSENKMQPKSVWQPIRNIADFSSFSNLSLMIVKLLKT